MRNSIKILRYSLCGFWLLYFIPPVRSIISGVYEWIATGLGQGYRAYADAIAPLLGTMSANRGSICADGYSHSSRPAGLVHDGGLAPIALAGKG